MRILIADTSVSELPPYLAEGAQTPREFAQLRGVSISRPGERFRVARTFARPVPTSRRDLVDADRARVVEMTFVPSLAACLGPAEGHPGAGGAHGQTGDQGDEKA
jgi:hypothetical protein